MAKPKTEAAPLAHLAGATDDHIPTPPARAEAGAGLVLEIFSATEEGADTVIVEAGRGQKIRAKTATVKLLDPAQGSRLKRAQLQPGKFKYE